MAYVDGFVIPVPTARLVAYRAMARMGSKVWMDHGALQYVECIADDVKPGKHTSFPQAVRLKPDEVVVFAYIVFRSRAHRDQVNKRAMDDPRLKRWGPENLPFDGKRMFWGGFKTLVQR
ncbi:MULTISPECIES: DUF1428 domain-containing protein [Pseudoxanthomonas]|uniref:Uncharacterized protein YbaA (DUF1428 family) n=1 Tax=Pseudoxanthomonas winnipegensis TaxID=2480810 RepID=A0AAW8GF95_9GAMM|nr:MULTISPECIES: DUF1428 domain-containing protein [Pseudoxanthomonas]MDQ1120431.1 uncharacterized protein YbaA (DUF1428 family) [Pseudoxanthomonas winnipegensis]MDQ1133650.1 uncharacterized protein YbaA (DUF1428 family) [Pseudoxanthomonas winnipegensis]MDR6140110.1 uncharacterized protein YbaA (DUF1428 family) [Pseudoxanthomonas sp. SORGH_AS_0997]